MSELRQTITNIEVLLARIEEQLKHVATKQDMEQLHQWLDECIKIAEEASVSTPEDEIALPHKSSPFVMIVAVVTILCLTLLGIVVASHK